MHMWSVGASVWVNLTCTYKCIGGSGWIFIGLVTILTHDIDQVQMVHVSFTCYLMMNLFDTFSRTDGHCVAKVALHVYMWLCIIQLSPLKQNLEITYSMDKILTIHVSLPHPSLLVMSGGGLALFYFSW